MSSEVNDKWNICRICLKDEHKKLYNIFEVITEEEIADLGTIQDKIELCGGIKLYKQNNLPNKICNRCVLLLRAAHKFRDLCQQSQNQLKQFINIQKEETTVINFDSDAEDQETGSQEEVDNVQIIETQTDGYVVEERIEEFQLKEDSQDVENNNEEVYISAAVQDEELDGFSDDDSPQYVMEEVNAKEFVNVENEEEITTYKYEDDDHNDNIIIEEQPGKPEARRVYIKKDGNEKKTSTKRKRKNSDDTEGGHGPYECSYCENTYMDKSKYNMHVKIHKKERPHICEICNKCFSTTPQLSRHMNSHTGNRPYKCKFCEARFGDPSTKIKHERIHTNERPYKCNMCDKAFAYSNVLKVHMMTHTGERPHSCEYCGKTFSQVHHKNAHEKRHLNMVSMVLESDSPVVEFIEEVEEQNKEEEIF